ncbi:MAG TPA: hypothetical protein VH370_13105 [Humisphaera sp.]|jgi:hypothetical protein|nr:hypothetical protein [Humisphaera sp.]
MANSSRNNLVIGGILLIAAGLVWFFFSRPTAETRTTAADAEAPAPSAHLGRKLADVLEGIPKPTTPERSLGGLATWTSTFDLSASEHAVITMRTDPAELDYASLEIPFHTDDALMNARPKRIAKQFLHNIAPDFDGGAWFDEGITKIEARTEQTRTTQSARATIRMSGYYRQNNVMMLQISATSLR